MKIKWGKRDSGCKYSQGAKHRVALEEFTSSFLSHLSPPGLSSSQAETQDIPSLVLILPATPFLGADVCSINGLKCERVMVGSELELTGSLVCLEEEGKDGHPGAGIRLRRRNGCLATAGVYLSVWLAV